MKNSLSNIRILSRAYASGRINRERYVDLRRQQADAIENGEDPPELPIDVKVQRYDEEDTTPTAVSLEEMQPATQEEVKRQRPLIAIVAIAATLALVLILDLLVFPETKVDPQEQTPNIEVELAAHNLLEKRNWDDQDVNNFLDQWLALTDAERGKLRDSLWFGRLNRVTEKRIRELEKLAEIAGPSEHTDETLARLRTMTETLQQEQE